jgi:hypothetical protein
MVATSPDVTLTLHASDAAELAGATHPVLAVPAHIGLPPGGGPFVVPFHPGATLQLAVDDGREFAVRVRTVALESVEAGVQYRAIPVVQEGVVPAGRFIWLLSVQVLA